MAFLVRISRGVTTWHLIFRSNILRLKIISVGILIITLCVGLNAQQGGVNSPFSRFGIGDLEPETPMHARQMGGLGTAFIETYHLNFDNPASLAHLQATAFNLGMEFKNSRITEGDQSSSNWSGNMSNLSLGFPLRNPKSQQFSREAYKFNMGMGFAVMPNSTTSYDITRRDASPNVGEFERNFSGEGGTWKAMWSNSIKFGDLSFGANLGVLFGNIEYNRNILFTEEFSAYQNFFSNSYRLTSFYGKLGAMYLLQLNKDDVLESKGRVAPRLISFGLTYKPQVNFSTTSDANELNIYPLPLDGSVLSGPAVDTLNVSTGVRGSGTLPGEIGFGAMYYGANKFGLGIDYRYSNWSAYRNEANPETLDDTYRIALGGYFRPDYQDLNNFLKRMSYRFGVYFEQDPRLINDTRISTTAVTFGMGMPLAWQRRFSNFDIGVTFGKRSVEEVLSENFAKITFGFTFNESDWFIKRKFN
ncbi:MAG: hypothetical protein AAFR14_01655 [Bacteroidota bacterium]